MRGKSSIKIHEIEGPRLPYTPREFEKFEAERVYLTADGIAVQDGEGVLYWFDMMPTSDAGSVRIYDNTTNSGNTIGTAYAAKALDGQLKSFDPPKHYKNGIYVDLTTSLVEICYKPFARNLRCTVAVYYAPGTLNLVARVNVVYTAGTKNLVSRVTVVYAAGTLDLISRVNVVYAAGTLNLVSRVVVAYAGATSDLVSRTEVLKLFSSDLKDRLEVLKLGSAQLVNRVSVTYTANNKWLYSQVTVTH